MPDIKEFLFDGECDPQGFAEGEAAFARGIGVDRIIKQVTLEMKNPNFGKDGSSAAQDRWIRDQFKREAKARGVALGYINGFFQAVRRIDQQLMNGSR